MMQFTFDLISDLHIETWNEPFDWSGRATSPHCVVVGDIAQDRSHIVECLVHLGQCYQAVFYIDGNAEHTNYRDRLVESYQDLVFRINTIPNVVYLQDNVVVVDGIAILGTNGWWGFDLDLGISPEQSQQWYAEKEGLNQDAIQSIKRMATTDANYMISSVKRLQTHVDVKKIVMVTHTVPIPELIAHDIDLDGSLRFNTMGNRFMQHALSQDTENKIHTWCFGHYHGSIDQTRNGVRYVNNCRGRGDTKYSQWAYHPLRITVSY
jgi:hypothetical protein